MDMGVFGIAGKTFGRQDGRVPSVFRDAPTYPHLKSQPSRSEKKAYLSRGGTNEKV